MAAAAVCIMAMAISSTAAFTAAPAIAAPAATLASTQGLGAGQVLSSPSGRYQAVMQGDGNLVVYGPSGAIWSSGTAGTGPGQLMMQSDGNLVLYSAGRPTWASNTEPSAADRLVMQDDGNLVIYDGGNRPLWSSFTGSTGARADTLATGQQLGTGQALLSGDGRWSAHMQGDGNLVVYGPSGAAWSSGTAGAGPGQLMMQGDGNLVLYAGGRAIWASGTRFGSGQLVMQNDGNLVLYAAAVGAEWSSRSGLILVYGPGPAGYICSSTSYVCDDTGYTGQAVWDFVGPHNCTNYAAWRLALRGVPRPGNLGDGGSWAINARAFGIRVDQTPTVGSIAEYDTGSSFAPAGHVAYVVEVGPGYIVLMEDNYPGRQPGILDVRRAVTGTSSWPNNFIHFAGS
ncbi:MAG: CHAP domain-containing protein [Actinobacteria bacterium]|nr:CHAP domain-containing protein [Actinomycetota bacterium]